MRHPQRPGDSSFHLAPTKPKTRVKRILADCFTRWRRFRLTRARVDDAAAVLAETRRLRLLSAYTSQWVVALHARRQLWAAADLQARHLQARAMRAWHQICLETRADLFRRYVLFHQWQRAAARGAASRKRSAVVAQRRAVLHASATLAAWRIVARARVQGRKTALQQRFAWWRTVARRRAQLVGALVAARALHRRAHQQRFLLLWRQRLRQVRAGTRTRLRCTLLRWAANVAARRRWRALANAATAYRRRRAGRRALAALKRHVRNREAEQALHEQATAFARRARLCHAVTRWRASCTASLNGRLAAGLGRQRRLRRVLLAWRADTDVVQAVALRNVAEGARVAGGLRAALRALRCNVVVQMQRRLATALRARHDRKLLVSVFRAWDRATYAAGMAAFRLRTARRFHDERLLRRAFLMFVCGATAGRAKC